MTATNLGFVEPTPLDPATIDVWGATINENFVLLDSSIAGVLPLNVAGNSDVNLTSLVGTPDQSRNHRFVFTGALTGNISIYFPPGRTQGFSVKNGTTGNFTLTIACGTSPTPLGTTVPVPQTGNLTLYSDGTNISPEVDTVGLGIGISTNIGVVGSSTNARASVTTSSATATFTADAVIVGNALSGPLYQLSSYAKALNLGTVGAGGMDVGTAPVNSYVSIYAIYGVSGSLVSIIAQDVANALPTAGKSPTIYSGTHMPAGYTASALIGIWPTDANGHFIPGYMTGRHFSFAGTLYSNLRALTWTSQVIAVPASAVSVDGTIFASTPNPSNFTVMFIAGVGSGTGLGIGQVSAYGGSTNLGFATVGDSGCGFCAVPLITPQTVYYYVGDVKTIGAITITGYWF